jgi:predicted permease
VNPLATKRGAGQFVTTIGKLRPGVTPDQASVDVTTIAKRLGATYKESNDGFTASVINYVDNYIGTEPRQLLYTMLGAVVFVLLIACANVANLLLDRAAHRTKEVGIRVALGASRAAVIRQFLVEAFVLSAVSAVLGVGVAHLGIGIFNRAIVVAQVPSFIDIKLHPPVLVFTILVALLTSLVSGAIPAYQSSRADINEVLKDETRGASSFRIGRLSKGLVMFEIALSCGLLVAAGLMIKSVAKLRNMDPGFSTRDVFTARVGFPAAYTDTAQQKQFFATVAERMAALPGVHAAAVSSGLPATRQGYGGRYLAIEGKSYTRDQDYPNPAWLSVTPGFFATLNVPIVQGRAFTAADREGALPVVIVNKAFAAKYFPGTDPIGHRLRYGQSKSTEPWATIVGVVPDMFGGRNENPKPAATFQPFAQAHQNFAWISARVSGSPLSITPAVRGLIASLNADIPIYWVDTLDESIAAQVWFVRVFGTMFMIFGFVALFLASVGLYAVMSFSVSRRTREVGIRMALGAQAADVVGMIFGQGLLQLGIGMAAGLAAATGIGQLLQAILFQVQPRDPSIFGGVVATLLGVGLLACFIPARRATRVDPLVALRSE